jgi:CDP-4-dehydro-6-deoxyglucose reductase, E1
MTENPQIQLEETLPSDPTESPAVPTVGSPPSLKERRAQILGLVAEYTRAVGEASAPFTPGRSPVRYAGRVYDEAEVVNLVDASLDFWLTEGKYAFRLETELCRFLGVSDCHLVNSGSSANLVAFSSLTSPKLGDSRVRRGDEVITLAAGFPTTVAPAIQFGAVPVFVDVDPRTANVDVSQLEEALSPRTKAVMMAHTLGNPFDIDAVLTFCRANDLWLIEDNCDALGSRYTSQLTGEPDTRYTGTFGHLSTSSFYPPHHMTTGEGGAVYTSDELLATIAASFRDWGRDCYCRSGKDNTCGKRFEWQFSLLPDGYDHKYVYSHFGYNLKMTDLQAAVGVAQMDKLPGFGEARRRNHAYLLKELTPFGNFFDFPEATPNSDPSWFGFLLTVRDDAPFDRNQLVTYLEKNRVATRNLFAGNLLRHPAFDEMRESGTGYRVIGELPMTDRLMSQAFWVGVYPGMGMIQLDYMVERIAEFCRSRGTR